MSDDPRLQEIVEQLDGLVPDARSGLPLQIFYLVSRLTPLVNVDLWIQRPSGEVLLTWRDDAFYSGWHVPGGIIRFKELAAERIVAVARDELGATVEAEATPLEVKETRHAHRGVRGHFIALLYRARLTSEPSSELACLDLARPKPGQWAWHATCPERLIPQHVMYKHLFTP